MMGLYRLEGHTPVPIQNLESFVLLPEERRNHRVQIDTIGEVTISTVFLMTDHSFGHGKPLLFETMIFGGEHDEYQERYSTWDEAEEGHKKALQLVQENLK